ncbi:Acetylcholine receptor-like protein cup-4 [Trichinella zimbabwensis]|uniref:Acetylcholine receptor-like protein cup-4 n=1 Tax=Trichinella zimbabwensis TaxID=268475 RepID=A0A0V1I733_9BILA|nr:Acetylcholine receptor-like protein cup-4 [Trichinella zimbabwensis]
MLRIVIGILLCSFTKADYRNAVESLISHVVKQSRQSRTSSITDFNDSTNIGFKVYIRAIDEINEFSSLMTMRFALQIGWTNTDLRWNPEEFEGIRFVSVPRGFIWIPKLKVINAFNDSILSYSSRTPISIWSIGYVFITPVLQTTVSCLIDASDYPKDEHECSVIFAILKDNDKRPLFSFPLPPEMRLHWPHEKVNDSKLYIGNWKLTGLSQAEKLYNPVTTALYENHVNKTDDNLLNVMEIKIKFQRHIASFNLTIVIPLVLATLLTTFLTAKWISNLLAIAVLVINLFMQFVLMNYMILHFPPAATKAPKIEKLYFTTICMTFVAISYRIFKQWHDVHVSQFDQEHKTVGQQEGRHMSLVVENFRKKKLTTLFNWTSVIIYLVFFVIFMIVCLT